MSFSIRIEALSKQYRLGRELHRSRTLGEAVVAAARHPIRLLRAALRRDEDAHFWALRDINLQVKEGTVLGVVGRNGAGKSTLLKVLSRVTEPTCGRAFIRGRLASLLEVGTGFHPELSGRDNIYLNATILGMRRREIAGKFDAIVAFSGVERFLDMPVKTYSSGMYVRLAFAIAAHVDASVLLVDEVLAVGDAEFQKRCLGKMGEVASQGRTVVFVSHNTMALRNLCSEGILLDSGVVRAEGSIAAILTEYAIGGKSRPQRARLREDADADHTASIVAVDVETSGEGGDELIVMSHPFTIHVVAEVTAPTEIGVFIHCYDGEQVTVFSSGSFFSKELNGRVLSAGRHAFNCEVPAHLLNDGTYTLDVMLVRDRHKVVQSELSVVSFEVVDDSGGIEGWNWRPVGVVRPTLQWRYSPQSAAKASTSSPGSAASTKRS